MLHMSLSEQWEASNLLFWRYLDVILYIIYGNMNQAVMSSRLLRSMKLPVPALNLPHIRRPYYILRLIPSAPFPPHSSRLQLRTLKISGWDGYTSLIGFPISGIIYKSYGVLYSTRISWLKPGLIPLATELKSKTNLPLVVLQWASACQHIWYGISKTASRDGLVTSSFHPSPQLLPIKPWLCDCLPIAYPWRHRAIWHIPAHVATLGWETQCFPSCAWISVQHQYFQEYPTILGFGENSLACH